MSETTLVSPPTDPEAIPKHESIPNEVFIDLLNGAANHEAKLLVTAILASQPGVSLSKEELRQELIERQGPNPGWPKGPLNPFIHVEHSLDPVAGVAEISVGNAGYYQVSTTETGEEYGMAVAGELLEWSLEYPDLSLQQVFGRTATPGNVRPPEARFHIYEALLAHESGSAAVKDIKDSLHQIYPGRAVHTVSNHMLAMEKSHLVRVKSAFRHQFDPKIKINNPNNSISWIKRSEETQLIYRAMQDLHNRGVSETSVSEIVATCLLLDDSVDQKKLRGKLVQSLSSREALPGLEVTDRDGIFKSNKSQVEIDENVRPAIEDLMQRLVALQQGINIFEAKQKAKRIIADPESVSFLMAKARRFSPSYQTAENGGNADLQRRMLKIVKTLGRATALEVKTMLDEEGRVITVPRAQQVLRQLALAGQLEVSEGESTVSRKKAYVYEPISSNGTNLAA